MLRTALFWVITTTCCTITQKNVVVIFFMTACCSWHEGTWLLHCLGHVALIGLVASFLNILNTNNVIGEEKQRIY
jgi:hypothetical protein